MGNKKDFEIDSYNKKVYGTYDFEPILIELLNSKPLQRLHHVQQHGPDVWVWDHSNITRFEHSLGVLLLLKKLSTSLITQIAGLIHDVSHTAFSHAIDFAFNSELSADFGDKAMEKFVMKSEIPEILAKYQLNINDVIDCKKFPVLKKSLPDLCADRIDYICRDMNRYGLMSFQQIHTVINSSTVYKNELIFTNRKAAEICGEKFIEAGKKVYGNPYTIFFHKVIGEAIRIAFDKNLISEDDLFSTDEMLKEKLIATKNKEIIERLSQISSKTKLIEDKEDFQHRLIVKPRFPNPKYLENGKILNLAGEDKEFEKAMLNSIKKLTEGYFIRVETVL